MFVEDDAFRSKARRSPGIHCDNSVDSKGNSMTHCTWTSAGGSPRNIVFVSEIFRCEFLFSFRCVHLFSINLEGYEACKEGELTVDLENTTDNNVAVKVPDQQVILFHSGVVLNVAVVPKSCT